MKQTNRQGLTLSVGHAVEEQPVRGPWPVLHQADVVAGLDARHGEQLQPLAGAMQGPRPRPPGDPHRLRGVTQPLPVAVDLGGH